MIRRKLLRAGMQRMNRTSWTTRNIPYQNTSNASQYVSKSNQYTSGRNQFREQRNINFMLLSIVGGGSIFVLYLTDPWGLVKDRNLRKEYGRQDFEFPEYICSEPTRIKQEIKEIFDHSIKQVQLENPYEIKFELITGISGSGKTTAVQQIIQEYRKQKRDAYYINLEQKNSQGKVDKADVQKQLQIAIDLITAVSKTAKKQKVPIVVIDGVNKLTLLLSTEQLIKFERLLAAQTVKPVKIFGISNASQYHLVKRFRSYTFKILKPLAEKDRQLMLESIVQHQLQKNQPAVLQYMMEKDYLPQVAVKRLEKVSQRTKQIGLKQFPTSKLTKQLKISEFLESFSNLRVQKKQEIEYLTEEKIIRRLMELDNSQQQEKFHKLGKIFQDKIFFNDEDISSLSLKPLDVKFDKFITQQILEENQTVTFQNCSRIQNKVRQKSSTVYVRMKEFFNDLEDENLVIYCRPPTWMEREVFTRYIKSEGGLTK